MLRKLMKYEFKATGRTILPLFTAALILSAISGLFAGSNNTFDTVPWAISILLAMTLIISIFVLVIVHAIQRFRQSLLSSEGHLMMTLPVKTDSIILSKLFVTSIWAFGSFLVAVASMLIMSLNGALFSGDGSYFVREARALLAPIAPQAALYTIEVILFIALAIFASILMLYACLSLGMLVNKRRDLFAFGAFVAISTVLQIVLAIAIAIGAAFQAEFRWLDGLFNGLNAFETTQILIPMVILFEAALCALFYGITRYMLKNKMNLL